MFTCSDSVSLSMVPVLLTVHQGLNGIKLHSSTLKYLSYIDDMTFLLNSDREYLHLQQCNAILQQLTGITINKKKTQVLDLRSDVSPLI